MKLVQLRSAGGDRQVAAVDDAGGARVVRGYATMLQLAQAAIDLNARLETLVGARSGEDVDLDAALSEGRVLAPIDHPDPAHCHLTGTGLTHLGSAEGRDRMHQPAAGEAPTDSMRMFRMGVAGGKPAVGTAGVQPEWFYKGDGSCIAPPEAALVSPGFALDGSEEPELTGIYLIDRDGVPRRIGFALANEFSDHVVERGNYLWLAHSKLRPAAIGPELLTGDLPGSIEGTSRIVRDGAILWERPFLTGEDHMSHSIANLEHHHFKYALFRRPGDVHVHFMGTATLSFADGIRTRPGDRFEIEAAPFTLPLRNTLAHEDAAPAPPKVAAL